MGTRYPAEYHCLLWPQLCIINMHPIFQQILFESRRRVFHLHDRTRRLNFHFSRNIVACKTVPVVDRDRVFAIRHVLRFAKWVSVAVKRKEAEVLVELSAGYNIFLVTVRG
jgi:hypothetical protein